MSDMLAHLDVSRSDSKVRVTRSGSQIRVHGHVIKSIYYRLWMQLTDRNRDAHIQPSGSFRPNNFADC